MPESRDNVQSFCGWVWSFSHPKPPGEVEGECQSLLNLTTAADAEPSNISAGVIQMWLSFPNLCLPLFFPFFRLSPEQWWEVPLTSSILMAEWTNAETAFCIFSVCVFSMCLISPPPWTSVFFTGTERKEYRAGTLFNRMLWTNNAVKAPSKKEQKYHRSHLRLKGGLFFFFLLFTSLFCFSVALIHF